MFGYLAYISAPKLTGRAVEIADGAYKLMVDAGDGTEVAGALIGVKKAGDGRLHIQQPSIEAVSDRGFIPKLILLTVYALTAVTAFYMLRIRRKLKKHHRSTVFPGSGAMTAAHWARFISGMLFLTGYVLFNSFGGVTYGVSAVLGISQAVCMGLCAVGAVFALISLGSKKENGAGTLRCTAHAAADVLCIAGILVFELYRFTGI